MKLDIYINYRGTCKQAFQFYEKHLDGKITMMMTHGENPSPQGGQIPADWILHAQIQIGDSVLMGADITNAEPMRSAYVTLTADTEADAERLYAVLSEGGEIFMKMEKTFFSNRFAMFRDRFGTSWMLLQGQ